MASSSTVAPIAGLSGALTTISRSGGAQVVYNGHPLYTYSADQAPGDDKGEGLFGKWFVATPDLAPAGSNDNNNGYSNGYSPVGWLTGAGQRAGRPMGRLCSSRGSLFLPGRLR
jgi:hypothetical protein